MCILCLGYVWFWVDLIRSSIKSNYEETVFQSSLCGGCIAFLWRFDSDDNTVESVKVFLSFTRQLLSFSVFLFIKLYNSDLHFVLLCIRWFTLSSLSIWFWCVHAFLISMILRKNRGLWTFYIPRTRWIQDLNKILHQKKFRCFRNLIPSNSKRLTFQLIKIMLTLVK